MVEKTEDKQSRRLLDDMVGGIVAAVGGEAGMVTLWDHQRHGRPEVSSFGLTDETLAELEPLVLEVADRLGRSGAEAPAEASACAGIPADFAGRRAMAFPLKAHDRLIGLLCLFAPGLEQTKLDANPGLRQMIVEQVNVVVQNARLLQRLSEEKRWLEAVIASSSDGVLVVDGEGKIVGLNPAMERLSGWQARQLRGQHCGKVLQMRDKPGRSLCTASCPLRSASISSHSTRPVEAVVGTRDGHGIDVEAYCTAIRSEDGELLGAIVNLRDISARKEAEELQSTFLSVISHELQTPVAVIRGYTELLGEDGVELTPGQLREKLGIIREESFRLSKMVENLLYASRIQAGGIKLQREPLSLPGLVRSAVQKMSGTSSKHTLIVEVPDDLPPVLADYERVFEVLTNLLDNAIKYSPRGGTISVGGRSTGSEVVISITDEGVGVPEIERDHIFDRFARLSSGLVRQRKGAGLGLFICKAIIEAHGGRIWVESAPRGGAWFSFSLPERGSCSAPRTLRPQASPLAPPVNG